jgi:hypothetical protein
MGKSRRRGGRYRYVGVGSAVALIELRCHPPTALADSATLFPMTSGITVLPYFLQSVFSAASSRSTITTREPAANIASVLANPMPDAAPVTTATLPSNSLAICLHHAGGTAPHSIAIPSRVVGAKDGLAFSGLTAASILLGLLHRD